MTSNLSNILGVILAGGQSRRMGRQDKSLAMLDGKRLVDHVFARLSAQVSRVIVSGNDDYGLGIASAPDVLVGRGPLAGLHGAMAWCLQHRPEVRGLICAPVDAPYTPIDLATRLVGDGPAIAATSDGLQPTFGYWPLSLYPDLDAHLRADAGGALRHFAKTVKARQVRFDDAAAFVNINAPEDLERLKEGGHLKSPLSIKAGPTAYKLIRENGFSLENVRVVVAASGGAKWLVLDQMDRVLFPKLKAAATAPVHLLCSSIGSWRMSMLAMRDPLAAMNRFESSYIDYEWLQKPNATDVSRVTCWSLDQLLGPNGEQEILSDPQMRMHILAVRSKNLLAMESRLPLLAGLVSVWGANALSRRNLRYFFERALFSDPRDKAPFSAMADDTGLSMINAPLNTSNYRDAVMATSSIPLVMDGISDISDAPKGMYRDGGFTDYHFNSAFLGPDGGGADDIILYPHYRERIIPGWFDKAWTGRGPSANYYDRALVIAPSDEFAARLPYGKIPDRGDFKRFDHETRVAYWHRVLDETARLGDALASLLSDDSLAAQVRPLS